MVDVVFFLSELVYWSVVMYFALGLVVTGREILFGFDGFSEYNLWETFILLLAITLISPYVIIKRWLVLGEFSFGPPADWPEDEE